MAAQLARGLGLVVLVAGVFLSLAEPSNTYKHQTHDAAAQNLAMEQLILNRPPPERGVEDRSRQPDMTREQRGEHFDALIDYQRSAENPR